MKHIFVVKKGSLAIWKRLDPDGRAQKSGQHDVEQLYNEKSSSIVFDSQEKRSLLI
jgi:hypothetical protein